jgi:hypothetical protein
MMGKHFAQIRPPQIERAAKVAKWHENTGWGIRHYREIDTAVHALQYRNGSRMFGKIALPRQPCVRPSKRRTMTVGEIE